MAAAESYPDDLKYHEEHDWARVDGDEAVLGITWFAADSLGELVHFEPPSAGSTVTKDASYGEVESVKAVSDVIAPLSGEVLEVNQKVVDAPALWDAIVARGVTPCGLGARDTLRLEACLALHGNDITPETDAISAGLGWTCALDKDFTGAEELRRIKADGPERKLVAFVTEERAIPRQGMTIDGGGEVTSGTHSPTLDVGIGMGYVPAPMAAVGTEVNIDVRGRTKRARVVKKPFYERED